MNDQASAKQQIVEKIKNSANILVTVNTDPTVDELAAALGLTMILDKLKKHSTAVVSGDIPPAIEFLEPGKTFESAVDSLRDFIIALDKEKADHLRYKVDGDVVKIFITPYRTTITSNDLDFSQGDYNVELVLALNVQSRDNLDKALTAHGRILHDATVATIGLGEKSKLGTIDWQDSGASSLSEMLVALSESLKEDKPLLDERISTAFLTGIVASTDRFSNERTSSRVMTMAAQLMAAGANQQLIAAKLEESQEITNQSEPEPEAPADDGFTQMNENETAKLERDSKPKPKPKKPKKPKKPRNDGTLRINHDDNNKPPAKKVPKPPAPAPEPEPAPKPTPEPNPEPEQVAEAPQEQQDYSTESSSAAAEAALDAQITQASIPKPKATGKAPSLSVADLQADIKSANEEIEAAAEADPGSQPQVESTPRQVASKPTSENTVSDMWAAPKYEETGGPTFGGTLNATTEAAAKAKQEELASGRNTTILTRPDEPQNTQQGGAYAKAPPVEPLQQQPPMPPQPPQAPVEISDVRSHHPSVEPSVPASDQNPFAAAAEAAGLTGESTTQFQGAPEPLDQPQDSVGQTLQDIDAQYRGKPIEDPPEDPRAAVEAAFGAVPFDPANNPQAGIGAQPMEQVPSDPQQPEAAPAMPPMPDFSSLPPMPPGDLPPLNPDQPQQPPQPPQNETLGDIFGSNDSQPQQPPQQPQDPTQFQIPGQ